MTEAYKNILEKIKEANPTNSPEDCMISILMDAAHIYHNDKKNAFHKLLACLELGKNCYDSEIEDDEYFKALNDSTKTFGKLRKEFLRECNFIFDDYKDRLLDIYMNTSEDEATIEIQKVINEYFTKKAEIENISPEVDAEIERIMAEAEEESEEDIEEEIDEEVDESEDEDEVEEESDEEDTEE